MGIEAKISEQLNRMPALKKVIKRAYQFCGYALSPKLKGKSEGDISCVSPQDDNDYFFGYYDKSPWDASERYMLCLKAKDTSKDVAPSEPAEILLLNLHTGQHKIIAVTRSWNVQQGCMLQWLGPDFSKRVIYNDFRNGKLCSVILEVETGKEKILDMPVYSVCSDGKTALTLDFSRLHRLRPGYGYCNVKDNTENEKLPPTPCVWRVNLIDGTSEPILSYTDLATFECRDCMQGAEHKANHIMINPSGTRAMLLHRWFHKQTKYTRLVTFNLDGSDLYNLCDGNMVSHCCWKNDNEILGFARKDKTLGYYLMKDQSSDCSMLWPKLNVDGHPSYGPDGRVVTDTYPDRARGLPPLKFWKMKEM